MVNKDYDEDTESAGDTVRTTSWWMSWGPV